MATAPETLLWCRGCALTLVGAAAAPALACGTTMSEIAALKIYLIVTSQKHGTNANYWSLVHVQFTPIKILSSFKTGQWF
jgi:hypothetical protein